MWGASIHLLLLSVLVSAVFVGTMGITPRRGEAPAPAEAVNPWPFVCSEEGKFPIPDSCTDYHVCRAFGQSFFKYELPCPFGNIFDSQAQSCLPSSAVTSRPDCVSVNVTDPSVPSTLPDDEDQTETDYEDQTETEVNCEDIQAMIRKITNDSHELCRNVLLIETYVNLLKSGIPIRAHYFRDSDHENAVSSYNAALKEAQRTVNVWRTGDDTLSAIRHTFQLVKEYEPEFDRKYKLNVRRIKTVSSSIQRRKEELQNDIRNLKDEIEELTSFSKVAAPEVQRLFESQVSQKERRLIEKERALNTTHSRVFEEIKTLLGMTSRDAKVIENKAVDSVGRLDAWYNVLLTSNAALKRQAAHINTISELLKVDATSYERSIRKSRREIMEFNNEKKALRVLMSELDSKIDSNFQKVKDLQAAIITKREEHERQRERICDVNGEHADMLKDRPAACVYLYNIFKSPLNLSEEEATLEQHYATISGDNQQLLTEIREIIKQLGAIQQSIQIREITIDNYQGKIATTNMEVFNLNHYSNFQNELIPAEQAAMSAIDVIVSSLEEVDCTFHNIHWGLDDRMVQAKVSERPSISENDVQLLKESIDQHLSKLQEHLDHCSTNINTLAECTSV